MPFLTNYTCTSKCIIIIITSPPPPSRPSLFVASLRLRLASLLRCLTKPPCPSCYFLIIRTYVMNDVIFVCIFSVCVCVLYDQSSCTYKTFEYVCNYAPKNSKICNTKIKSLLCKTPKYEKNYINWFSFYIYAQKLIFLVFKLHRTNTFLPLSWHTN